MIIIIWKYIKSWQNQP